MSRTRGPDGRLIVDETILDTRVMTVELDVMTATDMLPDVINAVGPGFVVAYTGGSMVVAVVQMAQALTGGKLSDLLPRLLASTTVIVPDAAGKLQNLSLGSREQINRALAGRKKLLGPLVKLAVEVNFGDFFDETSLKAMGLEDPPPESPGTPSA